METPTDDLSEIVTGLGATGAQIILAFASDWLIPANALVPTIQIADRDCLPDSLRNDVDLLYSRKDAPEVLANSILQLISDVRAGRKKPRSLELGNTAFQITRGFTGISL